MQIIVRVRWLLHDILKKHATKFRKLYFYGTNDYNRGIKINSAELKLISRF